jgi:molybdate transport system regulatory protein
MPMSRDRIDAVLALRSHGRFLIGRERIKLLEAVIECGSISKAAKATGFSYKTAWESVAAVNNLLPTPAFITKVGGAAGAGAEVTEAGRRLIATFRKLEERLARISNLIAEEGLAGDEESLLWALGARISARNVFWTEVTQVRRWAVDVEVLLRMSDEHVMLTTVTNDAAAELDLSPGRKVLAAVKAPSIRIVAPSPVPKPARNWFVGTVTRRVDAERNSEVRLDIGRSKQLIAVAPRVDVEALQLREGGQAAATFDANQVILIAE